MLMWPFPLRCAHCVPCDAASGRSCASRSSGCCRVLVDVFVVTANADVAHGKITMKCPFVAQDSAESPRNDALTVNITHLLDQLYVHPRAAMWAILSNRRTERGLGSWIRSASL